MNKLRLAAALAGMSSLNLPDLNAAKSINDNYTLEQKRIGSRGKKMQKKRMRSKMERQSKRRNR